MNPPNPTAKSQTQIIKLQQRKTCVNKNNQPWRKITILKIIGSPAPWTNDLLWEQQSTWQKKKKKIIIIFYEDIKHTCAQLSPKLVTDFLRRSDPNPLPLYTTTEVTVHPMSTRGCMQACTAQQKWMETHCDFLAHSQCTFLLSLLCRHTCRLFPNYWSACARMTSELISIVKMIMPTKYWN